MGNVSNKNCCGNQEVGKEELLVGSFNQIPKESFTDGNHLHFYRSSINHEGGGGGGVGEGNPLSYSLSSGPSSSLPPPSYLKKLKDLLNTAKKLRLKILSSSTLNKGEVIEINTVGMEGGRRGVEDGVSYFGCKKKGEKGEEGRKEKAEILNDFVIPSQDKEIAKRHRGRHFQIHYDISTSSYKIKDLGIGFGVFAKLDNPINLKDNHLINVGLVFMVVNLSFGNTDSESGGGSSKQVKTMNDSPALKLKMFGGPCSGEIHIFEADHGKPITIGRVTECTIPLDDNLLSKIQCSIEYKSDKGTYFSGFIYIPGWVLNDGKDRPSTNGTWVYLGEEQELYQNMVFKANQTLFQVSLI